LIDFMPIEANLNEPIMIIGQNFGNNISNIEVLFSLTRASIISLESDTIIARVPNGLRFEKSHISVSVIGNNTTFEEEFTLLKPIIDNFTPLNGSIGSTIQINGNNFNENKRKTNVYVIGDNNVTSLAEIISLSKNSITARIPQVYNTNRVKIIVFMNNFVVTSDQYFYIN